MRRRRITALLIGVAALTTLMVGQQGAWADPATAQDVYNGQVRTGTKSGAGTDANVWVYVNGSDGTFGPLQLDTTGARMEANAADNFSFTADLGELQRVCLYRDDAGASPSWYVRFVTIDDEDFSFERYIPSEKWSCVRG
jgi:hypothetical protein